MSAEPVKTTTLRLRRVRFKSGGELTVIRPPKADPVRDAFDKSVAKFREELGSKLAAFALVAVDVNGYAFVTYENADNSGVPAGGIGTYAKTMLDAETTIRWTQA